MKKSKFCENTEIDVIAALKNSFFFIPGEADCITNSILLLLVLVVQVTSVVHDYRGPTSAQFGIL